MDAKEDRCAQLAEYILQRFLKNRNRTDGIGRTICMSYNLVNKFLPIPGRGGYPQLHDPVLHVEWNAPTVSM